MAVPWGRCRLPTRVPRPAQKGLGPGCRCYGPGLLLGSGVSQIELTTRCEAVDSLRGSFGFQAAEWNMYAAPLVMYPAHISAPPAAAQAIMDRLGAAAFKTRGWAPWAAATELGMVFQIGGAPRD